jgi:hypothetical protein
MRFSGLVRQELSLNSLNSPALQLDWIWLASILAFVACSPALALAAGTEVNASHATPQLVNSPLQPAAPDYSKSTDHELTRLGARWDSLSAPERESLLREVKLRMAQRKDSDGVLMIRTQRRYGSVYGGKGRYLKIETKVIRVRPSNGGGNSTAGFGTGFEKRNADPASGPTSVENPVEGPIDGVSEGNEELPPLDAAMSPPVMRASDPSS